VAPGASLRGLTLPSLRSVAPGAPNGPHSHSTVILISSIKGRYYPPNFSQLTSSLNQALAILRDTSEGTSYQMVRWVFRPYTQV